MGSGGKEKKKSGDVTVEGDVAEGPSYEEKLRYPLTVLGGQLKYYKVMPNRCCF